MLNLRRALLLSLIAVAVLLGILWRPAAGVPASSLVLYCAAGIKRPVAAVARAYERELGVKVALRYGGSGTLLGSLQVARKGDLYLAADASYIAIARDRGLVAEALPLARLRPAIAVRRGNRLGINGLSDLLRPGLRLSLANPKAASVGKLTRELLRQRGLWERVSAAVRARGVFKPTVNEVANDVKLGVMDAGITWDATINQYPELRAVAIAGADKWSRTITIGVLKWARPPAAALRFARYLGARDRGLPVFKRMGFPPVTGDAWSPVPEIKLFCGAVNRPFVERVVKSFERREGVRVTRVYNGCGILLGQMRLGARPDIYQTCDVSFMHGVEKLFDSPRVITETDLVILCARGNPARIKRLADLARPGLKLGLGNEKQSTMGALTAAMLRRAGLYEQVVPNVVARTPTADLLVNQVRTGSLDAAIVYRANTVVVKNVLPVFPIERPDARARQSFAVRRDSLHRRTALRLFAALTRAGTAPGFARSGFRWIYRSGGE